MTFNDKKIAVTSLVTIMIVTLATLGFLQAESWFGRPVSSQSQTLSSGQLSGITSDTVKTTTKATTSQTTKASTQATTMATTTKPTVKATTQTTTKATTKTTTKATTKATTQATTTVPTTTAPKPTYQGKKWYAIGDSITAQDLYPAYLSELMHFSSYINDGRNGQQMATMGDRVTEENLATVDLVTVFGGTNDYGYNIPLGQNGDSAEKYTFYGNLQYVINRIRNANPEVEIIFMTPIKRGNKADLPFYPVPNDIGIYLEQYVQAIKDVCSKNAIRVIDLYTVSGINEDNLSIYTTDYLHPNEAGAKKIAEAIQRELLK